VELVIAEEDPRTDDVQAMLAAHLAFAHGETPAGHVHVLDVDRLVDPAITFFGARRGEQLLGVGALRRLDTSHVEVKSMHVSRAARGQGVGRAILDHLLAVAAASGYRRVSLETGTMAAFAAARALYAGAGFTPCEPFADYTDNPYSSCMTLALP
jgi:putative acetyltransferase